MATVKARKVHSRRTKPRASAKSLAAHVAKLAKAERDSCVFMLLVQVGQDVSMVAVGNSAELRDLAGMAAELADEADHDIERANILKRQGRMH